MNSLKSRRFFLQRGASLGLILGTGSLFFLGCDSTQTAQTTESKKPVANPCEDYSGLSEDELKKRQALGYVTKSPIPEKQCNSCNLWLPPAPANACGGCLLFKGPVYATAHCTYWAPQIKS